MKPALHFPFAAANTPKVRFGNVNTQLSVPGSLTCSLSVIVKLGECSVALTALKELLAIVALGAGGGLDAGGGEDFGAGGGVGTGLTPLEMKNFWTSVAGSQTFVPACLASIVHSPSRTRVTGASLTPSPLTVVAPAWQTVLSSEANSTGSPESGRALTVHAPPTRG